PARRLQQALPPAPAHHGHGPLRRAGRPDPVPGPHRRRRPAARGHRPGDGPGPRPARRGPRRGRPHDVLPQDPGVSSPIHRLAVPSQTLRANLTAWRSLLPPGVTLVSLAKGVELGTLKRMSEVVAEVAEVPTDRVAVLSGPNLAREIAVGQPTATVIACRDHD